MKTIHLMIAGALFVCVFAKAQTTPPTTNKKIQKQIDETGNFNMLDAQAGILGDLFGASDPNLAGVTDYKSLLNNLQVDPDLRAQLMTRYQIHRLSLDPTKEDSLKIMVTRMLEKAKQQSLEDPDRN